MIKMNKPGFTMAMAALFLTAMLTSSCHTGGGSVTPRQPVDTIGFARYAWQLDSIMQRIERNQGGELRQASQQLEGSGPLRVAVSPHDDYGYVGYLYPALLQHVRSEVVLLFGVGHKARQLGLENRLVFGSYRCWKSPAGVVKVSPLQEELMKNLPADTYTVNDSLQTIEHSLEALIPFLEYYNPDVEIIPVIVPAMPFERMEYISARLAAALAGVMAEAGLAWGSGWSAVISTDAVHYGNEEWGGKNYDRYGVDQEGYEEAVRFEQEIVETMLAGELTPAKIRAFSSATVLEEDYHEYRWTWCGRYAVPVGLLTAYYLAEEEGINLNGIAAGYSTSIAGAPLPVTDLGMGFTAPARLAHWVGYAAIGYR